MVRITLLAFALFTATVAHGKVLGYWFSDDHCTDGKGTKIEGDKGTLYRWMYGGRSFKLNQVATGYFNFNCEGGWFKGGHHHFNGDGSCETTDKSIKCLDFY